MSPDIEIDGEIGEGGGQVLRTSLTLSSLLGKSVDIKNIRAKRQKIGLMPQHLTVVNALAKITGAKVTDAFVGSTSLSFSPGEIVGGSHRFDIGTAGSISLLAQALIPVLLFSKQPSSLELIGGTHVSHSPTTDYLEQVFLPAISRFGAKASLKANACGFYPKGCGSLSVSVEPHANLTGADFSAAQLFGNASGPVHGIIVLQNIPSHVAERESAEIKKHFPDADIEIKLSRGISTGNAITLWKGPFGASALGAIGKSAESVAKEACDSLSSEIATNSGVDSRLADQLLVYMALARGKSTFSASSLTTHTTTNIAVIESFIGKRFETDSVDKRVSIDGIGFSR